MGTQMLRGVQTEPIRYAQFELREWAQNDRTGFGWESSLRSVQVLLFRMP